MAYLKPQTLTCPDCGLSARVNWVIGLGPNSEPGQIAYRRLLHIAPFVRDTTDPNKLLCPTCGVVVT